MRVRPADRGSRIARRVASIGRHSEREIPCGFPSSSFLRPRGRPRPCCGGSAGARWCCWRSTTCRCCCRPCYDALELPAADTGAARPAARGPLPAAGGRGPDRAPSVRRDRADRSGYARDRAARPARLRCRSRRSPPSRPGRCPCPGPGSGSGRASGEPLSPPLATADPSALLSTLAAAGAAEPVREALSHPAVRYASARERARGRLDLRCSSSGLFSLVPAVPLFRLHQWVSYGGSFGEYHAFGLKAYLLGFGIYWLLSAIYLLLFAAALRALGEAITLLAIWLLPALGPGRAPRRRDPAPRGLLPRTADPAGRAPGAAMSGTGVRRASRPAAGLQRREGAARGAAPGLRANGPGNSLEGRR